MLKYCILRYALISRTKYGDKAISAKINIERLLVAQELKLLGQILCSYHNNKLIDGWIYLKVSPKLLMNLFYRTFMITVDMMGKIARTISH